MGYKYELHLHTAEVSRCAECSAAGQVEVYRRLGYTGICITDHFFGGSNNIPPDIPWEEKIHRLASGYENAKKAAEGTGPDVFFGWAAEHFCFFTAILKILSLSLLFVE